MDISKIVIRDDVPVPPRKSSGRPRMYRIDELKVGQSILVPADETNSKKIAASISAAARTVRRNRPEYKFEVRTTAAGVGCWRVE